MIVDDEDLVRTTVARMLRRLGYQVLEAISGSEGLEVFARCRERIALVLLDLSMPEMPGEEVYARLRALAPALKVLVLTGYESAAISATDGLQVLRKPISSADLARKVRQALDN